MTVSPAAEPAPPSPGPPGALSVRSLSGTVVRPAGEHVRLPFGRDPGTEGVLVGPDDRRVSREHGSFTCRNGTWWLLNSGHTPIEYAPTRQLHADDEPVAMPPGRTVLLLVTGSGGRKHPLEVYVAAADHDRPPPAAGPTLPALQWRLTERERLVLTLLGQQFLRRDPRPQPMSRGHVAAILAELEPEAAWEEKKVDRVIAGVRGRLSAAGVAGLRRDEVPEPIGNSLNHNLLTELAIRTTTLRRADLERIDGLD
ncbi:FHA domain-containing protein [Amycolatopsis jiangsuensis]|uniref:FHA domain-containing protein n=1 Tax=Amycolatopsis jiangsuensis TaxID=1181879 RepID=A0A840IM29_9PSEU|nr:FHA domain-containing protein [Amycolatopsis jiangsuensis]MBB4683386.1 hypothetical protein [Amycolatopsis jiangsuensis]